MDINAYRYFVALEQYKTISATARKLFLTQPALTNYIKRMEQELGAPLIERGVYPVQFTKYGKIFLKYAKEIAASDQKMHDCLEAALQDTGDTIRISFTAAGMQALSQYLPRLERKIPHIKFEMQEGTAAACEERLLDGQADLIFSTAPLTSEKLESINLQKIPMVLLMAEQYPVLRNYDMRDNSLENPVPLDPADLNGRPFLMTQPQHGLHRATQLFFKENQITPGSIVPMESISACYRLAAIGGGILLLPVTSIRRLAKEEQTPVFCTLKNRELFRYVVMARNTETAHSEFADQVWNTIIKMLPRS